MGAGIDHRGMKLPLRIQKNKGFWYLYTQQEPNYHEEKPSGLSTTTRSKFKPSMVAIPLPAAALAGAAVVWALMKMKKSNKSNQSPSLTVDEIKDVVQAKAEDVAATVAAPAANGKAATNNLKEVQAESSLPVQPNGAADATIKAVKVVPPKAADPIPGLPSPANPPSQMSSAMPSKSIQASSEMSYDSRSESGEVGPRRLSSSSIRRLGSKLGTSLKKTMSFGKRVE